MGTQSSALPEVGVEKLIKVEMISVVKISHVYVTGFCFGLTRKRRGVRAAEFHPHTSRTSLS
jgi:hypothetical protein